MVERGTIVAIAGFGISTGPALWTGGFRLATFDGLFICQGLDHRASETSAQTSNAVASAKDKLVARSGRAGAACARIHSPANCGVRRSFSSRNSRNNSRILSSSPTYSISNFLFQAFAQTLLAAIVMLARAANRNAHHVRGFAQTQVFIENQMQGFSLPRGQRRKRALKSFLRFGPFKDRSRFFGRRASLSLVFRLSDKSQTAQQPQAMFANGCLANDGKQPRLQTGFAAVTRFPFKDLAW